MEGRLAVWKACLAACVSGASCKHRQASATLPLLSTSGKAWPSVHPTLHTPEPHHPPATQGNTAVYLLYAHARIAAIIRKSGKDVAQLAKSSSITLTNDKEAALAKHIAKFPGGWRARRHLRLCRRAPAPANKEQDGIWFPKVQLPSAHGHQCR
jgi:hypothetical protein